MSIATKSFNFAGELEQMETVDRLHIWGFLVKDGLRGHIAQPSIPNRAKYVFRVVGAAFRYEGNRLYATTAGKILALAMLLFFIRLAAHAL